MKTDTAFSRLGFALRLQRATHIQGMSTANKTRFHLPDGPAQLERDAKMAERPSGRAGFAGLR
jgi:hypothetical protein